MSEVTSSQNINSSNNVTGGGVDYDSGPYTITFPAGVTSVSFGVLINDDNLLEDDEEFTLTINPSDDHCLVGDPGNATVAILDDDCK